MSYAAKEIYYTLQGEGIHAGRAAVFLRFTGCNLWSGREQDRQKGAGGCSRWCDTDFVGTNGPGGGRFADAEELANAVKAAWPKATGGRPLVVCTGGEPLLQLDQAAVDAFHAAGFEVAVETNGTVRPPKQIDSLCVSPKASSELVVRAGHVLKLVYPQEGALPDRFEELDFQHFLLQPLDDANRERNTKLATQFCLDNPRWRLSLQTHKFLGIP